MLFIKYAVVYLFCTACIFAQVIGKVTSVSGNAVIEDKGKSQRASVGTLVNEGARIVTKGAGSRVVFATAGGGTVQVGADTALIVNKNTVKNREGDSVNLSLQKGALSCKIQKLTSSGSQFQVFTPNSVAGVRGTDFLVATGPDGSSTVNVNGGKVNVQSDGGTVDVGANQKAEAVLGASQIAQGASTGGEADVEKWLAERAKAVESDPAGTMDKMTAHLAKVENTAKQLAEKSDGEAKKDVSGDKDAVKKQQAEGMALMQELNRTSAASSGIMENAARIAEQYAKNADVKTKLNAIQRMNKSIDGFNNRVDAALGRLDAKLAAAYKRIDDSWKEGEDKINSLFNDTKQMKDFKNMDMDKEDDRFKIK